ncbi:MAG: TIM barrel protein [Clostridiales bacterium]|nr:TIM barrel protein [Clostridiales bacterium]
MIRFGVAGNSASFYAEGNTTTIQAAKWCKNRGIDMFEYSFGRGVNLNDKTALEIGNAFREHGIEMSVHAPYYINFANQDPEMIKKSIMYVVASVRKMKAINCGDRVVFHPATQGKLDRTDAFNLALDNIKKLLEVLEANELTDYKICTETTGKLSQIGDLKETVTIANLADNIYPCIDFGHLNARTLGQLKTKQDYKDIINYMLDNLPFEKVRDMHVHFSKIMYGQKGEIKHLTFEDQIYGPDFEPLAEILIENKLEPKIICESDDTQAEDAIAMKNIYYSLKG